MAEYIERDALLQDIEDSVRITSKTGMINPETRGAYKIIERIKSAAAADVVAVVRCKECKWYVPVRDFGYDETTGRRDHSKIVEKPYGECHGQNFHFTEDGCLRVGQDDFCSYGERKGE